MGRRAIEQLSREKNALMLVSLLQKRGAGRHPGLTMQEIITEFNGRDGDTWHPEEIRRLVTEIQRQWRKDLGMQLIAQHDGEDDGRKPTYGLKPSLPASALGELLRVAFGMILMRYGESNVIRKLLERRRGLHVLMSLFQALEARFVLSLAVENEPDPIELLPYRIKFNGGWWLYGWNPQTGDVERVGFNGLVDADLTHRRFQPSRNQRDAMERELNG